MRDKLPSLAGSARALTGGLNDPRKPRPEPARPQGLRTLRAELETAAIALLVSMAAASLLIIVYGRSPLEVFALMARGTFGDAYGFGQLLFRATPIIFTGLSVALALRAGLFNIGAEGQLVAGSLAAGVMGAALPADSHPLVALPACLVAAGLAGAAVALLPALLRAYRGAHEVISTMMLNFIVVAMVNWIGAGGVFERGTVHTPHLVEGARLPGLGVGGSAASVALPLGLMAAGLVTAIVFRTRWGFEVRALGLSPEAARAGGVPVARRLVTVMLVAGALAALGSSATVLGYKGFYEQGLGAGSGFLGVAVAVLARAHPLAVILAAFVLGFIAQGTLEAGVLVPKELGDVLQGVVILAVAAASARRGVRET
jgi:ABC-type uncharacterized transport system permease subunit